MLKPGIVQIKIAQKLLNCLRRGSYMYAIFVSDKLGANGYTANKGEFLLEYSVAGPQHDIWYKDRHANLDMEGTDCPTLTP